MQRRVLVPLPDRDFDVTEVAVPWRLLTDAGARWCSPPSPAAPRRPTRCCSTASSSASSAPAAEPKRFYAEMQDAPRFRQPIAYADIVPGAFDALLLPGGHATGHAAVPRQHRAAGEGRGVLGARPTGRRDLPRRARAGPYQGPDDRPQRHRRPADDLPAEVHGAHRVPHYRVAARPLLPHLSGLRRGRGARRARATRSGSSSAVRACWLDAAPRDDDSPAFVVQDGRYVSARWPGDAYAFGRRLVDLLRS